MLRRLFAANCAGTPMATIWLLLAFGLHPVAPVDSAARTVRSASSAAVRMVGLTRTLTPEGDELLLAKPEVLEVLDGLDRLLELIGDEPEPAPESEQRDSEGSSLECYIESYELHTRPWSLCRIEDPVVALLRPDQDHQGHVVDPSLGTGDSVRHLVAAT